ncbi:MAG: STAS domain-containing protein [Thermoleophilia bacterium]|nr:STAS domain-containing protein [Thermoleophilia bacterium]
MDIIGTSLNGVPLLTIVGEADQSVGPELAQAAQRAMSSGGTHILLNLELCSYLDSGALGVILCLVREVEPGGWVGVISCSHMVLRLFDLAGLAPGESFRMFQSLDDARAAAAAV